MAVKKESYEQAKVKKWFKTVLGGYMIKTVVATEAGTLDLIGCFRSIFIAIEMKRVGEKTNTIYGGSPLQNEKIKDIRAAGGIAFVAETLEEVKHTLYKEFITRGIDPTPLRAK